MDQMSSILDLIMYRPVASLAALALASLAYSVFPATRSSIQYLPLPSGAELLWGHEKTVFTHQPGMTFRKWIWKLGPIFRIKAAFGAPDILVLSDPAAITYILQKKIYDYHHSSTVRPRIARLLGKGLGWVEGEVEHKRMKRLAMPTLTADNIQAMSNDVTDCIEHVIAELKDLVQRDGAGTGTRINVLDWTGKATLNVVGRFAFLHDFEGGNSEDAQKILNARKAAVPVVTQYIAFLTLMLLRRFPILNHLPINAIQSQGLAKRTIQAGVAKELIRRNLSYRSHDKSSKDLLSRLLNAAAEEHITMSEVYEHISTFIISGFETTTTVIGFAAWELSRHPDKQARLREELLIVNNQPTYKDLYERLPYLDAVLKEILRLYPALPYMERVATKDDTLPLSQGVLLQDGRLAHQLFIEAGQTVIIPIISIHRQDSVWQDPDDFYPERWLEPLPQEKLLNGWGNLLAFSDGPRSCIGARLAVFNAKLIISSLVSNFLLEDAGGIVSLKIVSSLQPWTQATEGDLGINELPVILKPL